MTDALRRITLSPPRFILFAVLLAGALATAAPASTLAPELVSSDESGIRVTLSAGDPSITTFVSGGVEYSIISLPGASVTGEPGMPELPCVRAVLAVPECDAVELDITVGNTRRTSGVRVIPSPGFDETGEGELSRYPRAEGEVYRSAGVWPERAARVTAQRWLGPQRIVTVELYPCRFAAETGELLVHGSLDVTLRFRGLKPTGRETAGPARVRPRQERLLETVLLNAESSREWRRRGSLKERTRPDDYYSTSQNWVRIRSTERGFYRVDHDDLANAGVSASVIDPETFRVFSGGGLSLPPAFDDPRPGWMQECTILVDDGGDGSFDSGDGVVFYALAEDGWSDEFGIADPDEPHHENHYANENIYWLTWEDEGTASGFTVAPLRMAEDDLQNSPTPVTLNAQHARTHFERNIVVREGRADNWYWHDMGLSEDWRYFHELLEGVVTDSLGTLRAHIDGNSSTGGVYPDHHVRFLLNNEEAYDAQWDAYQSLYFEAAGLSVNDGYNTFAVNIPRDIPGIDNEAILIDWFELLYWKTLEAADDQVLFGSSGKTGVLEFSIAEFSTSDIAAFKIIDQYTVRSVPGVTSRVGDDRVVVATFQDDVADTASYGVIADGGYLEPVLEFDTFVDLRTATDDDYIMIAHDDLYEEAQRLKTHRESDAGGGFDVRLVRVSDVYDEFSWGVVDPTAIRDYLKLTWETAANPPTHVVLIGDGTVDPRSYSVSSLKTYIPVHYTLMGTNSAEPSYWPTEFWYAGFDAEIEYVPGVALGRLTANSVSELATMIDKIIDYDTDSTAALWRNTAILVGDDEYTYDSDSEYFHAEQTELISEEILPFALDRKKLFLMEYDKIGPFKPAARAAFLDMWNEGAFLVNYTGHGSEIVMAHESVFYFDDVTLLSNRPGLPFFFAASCRLNKFDRMTVDSLGEALAKSATGGSIVSMGSTRDSGASQNANFNRDILGAIFGNQQVETDAVLDIGLAVQAAVALAGGYSAWLNDTRFMIVGDPAIVLATPGGSGNLSSDEVDPMMRRDEIAVEGTCSGATSNLDGIALVRVNDSADTTGYTLPSNGYHVRYALSGDVVFDGPVAVSDGGFDARFIVSHAAAEGPYGRIRAYCYDDDIDGAISLEGVAIRDSVETTDATGPVVTIEFAGGATSVLPGSELMVTLSDESGINTVIGGRGVPISLLLDGGDSTDVTGLFSYDVGSYQSGEVDLDLPSLSYGAHTVEIEASDNMGNRSTGDLWFEVVSAADFEVRNVANYPNPFPDGGETGTWLMFQLPGPASVRIDIFTVGGRRVRTLDDIPASAGANQIYWDGLDVVGDELANGVYLYRILAVSESYRGDKAEAIGRAVIMR